MRSFALLFLACALGSCADTSPNPLGRAANECAEGTAQIGVYDGFLQGLCGCSEGFREPTPSGTPLTCTVPLNSFLTFVFLATKVPHQILSEGSPSFASSPYSDPMSSIPVRAHQVQLTTAGSYSYRDAVDSGLTGTIVVTP